MQRPAFTIRKTILTPLSFCLRQNRFCVLFFPSSIAHSVSPNPSDRPRISIAIDTLFTLKEYIRDEPLWPPSADLKQFDL